MLCISKASLCCPCIWGRMYGSATEWAEWEPIDVMPLQTSRRKIFAPVLVLLCKKLTLKDLQISSSRSRQNFRKLQTCFNLILGKSTSNHSIRSLHVSLWEASSLEFRNLGAVVRFPCWWSCTLCPFTSCSFSGGQPPRGLLPLSLKQWLQGAQCASPAPCVSIVYILGSSVAHTGKSCPEGTVCAFSFANHLHISYYSRVCIYGSRCKTPSKVLTLSQIPNPLPGLCPHLKNVTMKS